MGREPSNCCTASAPGSHHACPLLQRVLVLSGVLHSWGCGMWGFPSHRLWAHSPNTGDSSGDKHCPFVPLLMLAGLHFPPPSNGGKVVSKLMVTRFGTSVWPSMEPGGGLCLNISQIVDRVQPWSLQLSGPVEICILAEGSLMPTHRYLAYCISDLSCK